MAEKIVGTITRIVHPLKEKGIAKVFFGDGQTALLDLSSRDALVNEDVLDQLQKMGTPAYVEVNPDQVITVVLIPLVVMVTALVPRSQAEFEVELEPSQARHFLRLQTDGSKSSLTVLRRAMEEKRWCVVTEAQDTGEIIDVQLAENPEQPAPEGLAPAMSEMAASGPHASTPQRAHELFNLVCNQSCDPNRILAPCIPFCFPDDGCWARAHEMCRIILKAGDTPRKLWIYGDLEVNTRNNPHCKVLWRWHVAPTLKVMDGGSAELWVIDPAMFPGPVPDGVWKAEQNYAAATVASSDPSIFLRDRSGLRCQTDPTYQKTEAQLNFWRVKLIQRAGRRCGPPPYAHCCIIGDSRNEAA